MRFYASRVTIKELEEEIGNARIDHWQVSVEALSTTVPFSAYGMFNISNYSFAVLSASRNYARILSSPGWGRIFKKSLTVRTHNFSVQLSRVRGIDANVPVAAPTIYRDTGDILFTYAKL